MLSELATGIYIIFSIFLQVFFLNFLDSCLFVIYFMKQIKGTVGFKALAKADILNTTNIYKQK